jgi:hypothetical protein
LTRERIGVGTSAVMSASDVCSVDSAVPRVVEDACQAFRRMTLTIGRSTATGVAGCFGTDAERVRCRQVAANGVAGLSGGIRRRRSVLGAAPDVAAVIATGAFVAVAREVER